MLAVVLVFSVAVMVLSPKCYSAVSLTTTTNTTERQHKNASSACFHSRG
jgi:hypothetical protein